MELEAYDTWGPQDGRKIKYLPHLRKHIRISSSTMLHCATSFTLSLITPFTCSAYSLFLSLSLNFILQIELEKVIATSMDLWCVHPKGNAFLPMNSLVERKVCSMNWEFRSSKAEFVPNCRYRSVSVKAMAKRSSGNPSNSNSNSNSSSSDSGKYFFLIILFMEKKLCNAVVIRVV